MVIFDALNAYQKTKALQAAVELDIFTHIADGATTAAELAKRSQAAERGVRILCDFLTIHGLLTKTGSEYGLTIDTGAFMNRHSPAYIGAAVSFLAHQDHSGHFSDLTAVVRKGGSLGQGNLRPSDPVWVEFARSMAPLMAGNGQNDCAHGLRRIRRADQGIGHRGGHGLFGIQVALTNPAAQVVGLDWGNVLEVARENAAKAGVADRYTTIEGSAFEVDFGSDYDLILLPNFLHHFDHATNVQLLKKAGAALKPNGVIATVEEVPNDDRVTPPIAAFSIDDAGDHPGRRRVYVQGTRRHVPRSGLRPNHAAYSGAVVHVTALDHALGKSFLTMQRRDFVTALAGAGL